MLNGRALALGARARWFDSILSEASHPFHLKKSKGYYVQYNFQK